MTLNTGLFGGHAGMNSLNQIGFAERLVEIVGEPQLVEFPTHILFFIRGESHHRSFSETREITKILNGLGATFWFEIPLT